MNTVLLLYDRKNRTLLFGSVRFLFPVFNECLRQVSGRGLGETQPVK